MTPGMLEVQNPGDKEQIKEQNKKSQDGHFKISLEGNLFCPSLPKFQFEQGQRYKYRNDRKVGPETMFISNLSQSQSNWNQVLVC